MLAHVAHFFKTQVVLSVSGILAIISCFIVPPNPNYASYVDYRTILLLFSFMCVISGLQRLGSFDKLSSYLLSKARTEKDIAIVLVVMCFFLAMFITNDITLITLVPLTLIIFSSGKAPLTKRRMHLLVITLVLESLSANFGGMMMPFGSPQNIYLYSFFNMTMLTFFTTMLPFAVSGIIVLLFIMHFIKYDDTISHADQTSDIAIKEPISHGSEKLIIFMFLFALAIASVAHVLDYRLVTLIILVATILLDWKVLKKVNYVLLFTFIFFFIFVGNIGTLPILEDSLRAYIDGHEVLLSILTSQVTSNVPASILLSKFTNYGEGILIGTNIGGMGTLIASMASLITYQLLGAKYPHAKLPFLKWFSIYNFGLLIIYFGFYLVIR